MSLTALVLLLAAFAVHAALTRTQVKMGDRFPPKQCRMEEMLDTLRDEFTSVVPESAVKAYTALKSLEDLVLKSPDDLCKPQSTNSTLIKAFDLVWGAYSMLKEFIEEVREEVYVQNLAPYWAFLPEMHGTAQRLIEEGHYCEHKWCAAQETFRTMFFASDEAFDAESVQDKVQKELERVQKVAIRSSNRNCTETQIKEEIACVGFNTTMVKE